MADIGHVMRALVAAVSLTGPAGAAAFPGADGYGADADGWRGGRVIAVTSLQNDGPGTLRACAESDGPRVCIFKVAGTISVNRPIMVRSNVYIAGQTAPGGGIQIRLGQSRSGPLVIKNASDIVVRFLKIRPGTGGGASSNIDAVTVENARNVYLGNLSLAFASDETVNVHVSNGKAQDITLSDSILAYSLDQANHPDGKHSKGALICSHDGVDSSCGRISLLRNIFAHHRDRNPDIKASAVGAVEVINNIFFDPISQFGEFYDTLGDTRIAYVGNLALTGRSTIDRGGAFAVEAFKWEPRHKLQIHARDNLAFRWIGCESRQALPILDPVATRHSSGSAIAPTITPMPARLIESSLPSTVGDMLPGGAHRDQLDRRVLDDLARCQGRVIDNPQQAGGWPLISAAAPPGDQDGDHLPDAWEVTQPGLDPRRRDDPWTTVGQMTAIEAWLADLAGDR